MLVINASNVNDALGQALSYLKLGHEERDSRYGRVVAFPAPVMTVYREPMERVLFSPQRNANPFFHFFEALWMLAGRNDVAFPARFVKRMQEFSDDGSTLHGAYGHRWRRHFSVDQLRQLIALLRVQPGTRRAVLNMWCPQHDLARTGTGRDVPCNTAAYFDTRQNRLNMTVCCRSNDVLWGAYGANAVHFSFLLEYVARHLGLQVGVYRQFSNDLHVYTDQLLPANFDALSDDAFEHNHYREADRNGIYPRAILCTDERMEEWDVDLALFFQAVDARWELPAFQTDFWDNVAAPLWRAWGARNELELALSQADGCLAADWRKAAYDWLIRRWAHRQELAAQQPTAQPTTEEAL